MLSVACPLDAAQTVPVLRDRPDYEYGVTDRLDYHQCSGCGIVFADPIPEGKLGSFYTDYMTHGQVVTRSPGIFGRLSRRMTLREFALQERPGPLLDYGCGNGSFLAEMRGRGHAQRDLVGYDFDPVALVAAEASGATIVADRESLAAHGPYATITLNHVIEHLVDPVADLVWLSGMLAPGGRIVIRTPNARSLLSRMFKASWRGWETPRHLHVFTPKGFHALASAPDLAGLRLVEVRTSQAMFLNIFHGSVQGARWHRSAGRIMRHGLALLAFVALLGANTMARVGEELVVVLERR